MTVYFLRHASAGQHTMNASQDEKRPLDEDGIKQSHDVGRALKALKIGVDAIISSPLTRALQTAEIVGEEIGHKKIVKDAALRPDASYEDFQKLLGKFAGKKEIIVAGHNPNLTEFLNHLLADGDGFHMIDMKKGAVAKVEIESSGGPKLAWYMPPKVIRALQKGSAKSSRPKTVLK